MSDYERVLLVKPEIFVYKIPPRTSNKAVRATDWGLSNPAFTGRMRIVSLNQQCIIKIEDQNTGSLFAKSIIEEWPTKAVEPVSDSSRYFILRITSDDGRQALVGIGFADRSDSFDMNVTCQDHFKQIQAEKEQENLNKNPVMDNTPKLDLGLKAGQTIKINLSGKTSAPAKNKPKSTSNSGGLNLSGFLPPPPSKNTITSNTTKSAPPADDFGDFSSSSSSKEWVQF